MHVLRFTFNAFQENTYVLFDDTKECIIIDPGMADEYEDQELFEELNSRGLTPTRVLLTHCHIDHILGNASVVAKYGIPLFFHEKDQPVLDRAPSSSMTWGIPYRLSPEASGYISEKDVVTFGNTLLEIRFVPGHAPGHIAFIHHESGTIVSGDVLFRESVGRTDLPGCNHDDLMNSIRTQLYSLPDHYTVLPGHGLETTIGWEKQRNPFCPEI